MFNYRVEFFDKNGKKLKHLTRTVSGPSDWDVSLELLDRVLPSLEGAEDFNLIDL